MRSSSLMLFILLGALSGLTPLAVDMYLPAIPSIARDLGAGVEAVQLTISVFLGGFALGQLFYGPLADSFGRKPVILFGVGLFFLASVGCAFAQDLPTLLGFRLLQALGGAAGSVVVNALLRDLFSHEEFARAMSLVILTMTLAPLVAPLLGGYLLYFGWHWIFGLLALLGLLVWLAIWWQVPETLKPENKQALHLGRIWRNYVAVFRHRQAMGGVLAGTFSSAGMFAFISGSPYVYIEYFGVPASRYGWLFGLNVLLLMLMTFLNSRLIRRIGAPRMLRLGLRLLCLAGVLQLVMALSGWGGLWGIVLPVVLYVGQIGLVGANAMSETMGHFPANAGTASAVTGTLRFLAGALAGVAVNLVPASSPVPMALVMAGCGLCALLAHGWLAGSGRQAVPA